MKLKEFFMRKKLSRKGTSSKDSNSTKKDAPIYQKEFKLDDFSTLIVKVDVPKDNCLMKAKVIMNEAKVDEYLEGLDETLTLKEVYSKVMELFDFLKDDISESNCITVCYVDRPEKRRAKNRK